MPSAVRTTAKSMDSFGHCFTEQLERDGRAWSFVPNDEGGRFSNRGDGSVAAGYELVFREGPHNKITVGGTAQDLSLIEGAINACR